MNFSKKIKVLLINLLVLLGLVLLMQGLLVLIGVKPYSEDKKANIIVENNKRFFQKDSLLGYKHCAGHFDIQLKEDFHFTTSHNENTFRKTKYELGNKATKKPAIWLLGCSFTYGWSLNDEQTFAWCLQEKLENFNVVNMAVNGYGTIHFYLQLTRALKSEGQKPKLIIVNHADFHHERNINSYNYNRAIATWNNFGKIKRPFVETKNHKELEINYCENEYTPWAISKKYALAKSVQFKLERFIDGRKFKTSKKITARLLDEINKLCQKNNIQLLLTNVGLKKEFIRSYTSDREIPFVDVAVNYRASMFNNLPFDKHPNAIANDLYCERIYDFMVEQGLKE